MFHLCAYYNGTLGTAVDTDVPALTDSIMYIQNNHFLPQVPTYVYGMWAGSATLQRSKLSTPKLRQISPVYIRPIQFGAQNPAANPNMDIRVFSPLLLQALEEIQNLVTASPATTEPYHALLWLVDNFQPAPLGDVYNLRWTSTVTATANAWTNISPPIFELQLPLGTYAVIDSECFSTNSIAHRLIFDQQYQRPGNISFGANGNRTPYRWQYGALGQYGAFRTTNLPRVEVLCSAGDASFEGYMHCVKIG
jgi:hypothetical protein